jgi:formylglycine-generating enzyme required for sulfatase activity
MQNEGEQGMCSQWKQGVVAILAVGMLLFSGQNGSAQERSPVPDAAAQQAAKKTAGEIYGGRFALAKTADEQTALAAEMIAAGLKIQPGSADQFVLLDIARGIAAGAGDAATSLSAVKELTQRFDVPALTLEADTLLTVARQARISTQRRALAEASVNVIGKLAEADEYDRAIRLCEAAREAAQQSREHRLGNELSTQLPELRRAQQELRRYRDALAVMEDAPTEPAPNLAAGRYLCLIKGDWERGVPMLALGSDEPLKAVAVMELQGAETAEQQAAIGDAWWDVAETREGQESELLRLRAGSYYRRAAPQLAASLAGLRIKQRLEEIAKLERAIPRAPARSGPPRAVAPFDERTAKQHQAAWAKHLGVPIVQTNLIGMRFVLIPPGEFDMGSNEAEVAKLQARAKATKAPSWYIELVPVEAPKHRVRITRSFALGMFEVTQAEYERVMRTNPSRSKGDPRRPVEQVSWEDAVEFCRRLSALPVEQSAGRSYRLPTEAEWEYACRAGTTTTWQSGDDEAGLKAAAWYGGDSRRGSSNPVGQKQPNAWGLYDMHGNVWEWCSDWHGGYISTPVDDPTGPASGSSRVYRGGGWNYDARFCRSAYRAGGTPDYRNFHLGFRVASSSMDASGR